MDEVGIDISAHRGRRLAPDLVDGPPPGTMSRQHSIDPAVEFPSSWQHCFTVSELEQRAWAAGDPGGRKELGLQLRSMLTPRVNPNNRAWSEPSPHRIADASDVRMA